MRFSIKKCAVNKVFQGTISKVSAIDDIFFRAMEFDYSGMIADNQ
jgi:hypothetical protein